HLDQSRVVIDDEYAHVCSHLEGCKVNAKPVLTSKQQPRPKKAWHRGNWTKLRMRLQFVAHQVASGPQMRRHQNATRPGIGGTLIKLSPVELGIQHRSATQGTRGIRLA